MHESRTFTPYPPKLGGFQTRSDGKFLKPSLALFLHPPRVVPVKQWVAHTGQCLRRLESLHRVQRYQAEILSYLWHQLHHHSLVSITEPVSPLHSSLQWRCSHGSPFYLSWKIVVPAWTKSAGGAFIWAGAVLAFLDSSLRASFPFTLNV